MKLAGRYTLLRKTGRSGSYWIVFDNERNEEVAIRATRREARAYAREVSAMTQTMKASKRDHDNE